MKRPLCLLIVHNPTAGNRRRALYPAVIARLEAAGCKIVVKETRGAGEGVEAARAASEFDRVVVVGGDGTFNEVINGVADLDDPPPLAIIPEGTSNVLAAEIGLPRRAGALADVILNGELVPISLGCVNGRYFAVMMGAGLDAYLVARVDEDLKRRLGSNAYVASLIKQLREFGFPHYSVTVDGEPHVAGSVIVANASRYSRSWKVAPTADIRVDKLQVCRVSPSGRWGRIGSAVALFGGRLSHGRGLEISAGAHVIIDGPPGDPVQADGDIVTTLPAEVKVRPAAVNVLYPR